MELQTQVTATATHYLTRNSDIYDSNSNKVDPDPVHPRFFCKVLHLHFYNFISIPLPNMLYFN